MLVEVSTRRLAAPVLMRTVRGMLEALTPLARLQCRGLPPLYQARVAYRLEDGGESLVDPVTVHRRGWGDCAHLSLWRCAEHRESGIDARYHLRLMSVRPDGSRLFHVLLRLPSGRFEDPSLLLGMPASPEYVDSIS